MSAPSEKALHAAREATTHEWSMREILKAAMDPALGPDRLVVAGPHEQEIIEKVIAFLMDRSDDSEYGEALQTAVNEITTRFLGAS